MGMMKKLKVNGEMVRKEREKRAWTQEELSERSQLGVRTLRRLEAGFASMETLRRVTEALDLAPEDALPSPPGIKDEDSIVSRLQMDQLTIEMSVDWLPEMDALCERISSVRRHIASELGLVMPGVRLRDNLTLQPGEYRILIRELPAGQGRVPPGAVLVVGKELGGFPGERTSDPTYGMPAVWTAPEERSRAEAAGCMVFTPISVLCTHLTYLVRVHASRLLGVEEVHFLLNKLGRPQLLEEVVPKRISLLTLQGVLVKLLEEGLPIRDLSLILETLGAAEAETVADLTEVARRALKYLISHLYADAARQVLGLVLDSDTLELPVQAGQPQGHEPLVIVSPESRRDWRARLPADWVVLSTDEIAPGYTVVPVKV